MAQLKRAIFGSKSFVPDRDPTQGNLFFEKPSEESKDVDVENGYQRNNTSSHHSRSQWSLLIRCNGACHTLTSPQPIKKFLKTPVVTLPEALPAAPPTTTPFGASQGSANNRTYRCGYTFLEIRPMGKNLVTFH